MLESYLEISNLTKSKIPSLPFLDIKNEILSKKYYLSIAFVGDKKMHELNLKYRQKDRPTNVLSFCLSKNSGELILCPTVIKKEQGKFERNFSDLLLYLVIHGMLHLKGLEHSSKMDIAEKKYEKKYRRRSGHRIRNNEDRSGRISKRRKKS